MGSLLDVSNN